MREEQTSTPPRAPNRPSTQPSVRLLLLVLLCSPLLFAMQCANEDLSQEFLLELDLDGASETYTITLPYTGRIALDVGVDAAQDGEIQLRSQVRTSGDPDEEGCDAIAGRRTRDIDAAPWDGNLAPIDANITYPRLSNLSVRTQFTLPYNEDLGAYAGAAELATDHELVRLYTTDNDLSLWDLNGNIVPPVEDTHPATCDDVFVTVYEMPRENVRIAFHSDQEAIDQVLIADCAEDRVVDRVCPGFVSEIQDDTFSVESAHEHIERYSALGVGDTVVLEGTCDGACPATLRLFAWLEPLQCRTKNDCSGGRECTDDGYCIKEPPPACASPDGRSNLPAVLMAVCLLWVLRRTAHHEART